MKPHDDMFRRVQPQASSTLDALKTLPADHALQIIEANSQDRSAFELLFAIWMYRRNGHQVFCVGSELQEMFSQTSIARVPVDTLSIPYQGFYVALPDCEWLLWGGSRSQWHKVRGVYMAERFDEEDRRVLHLLFWGEPNERSKDLGDDATLWMTMDMDNASELGNLEAVVDLILGAPGHRPVHKGYVSFEKTNPEIDKILDGTCRKVIRTVFNMMLYIGTDNPDLKITQPNQKRRQKLQKRMASMRPGRSARSRLQDKMPPPTTITYVGPGIESELSDVRHEAGKGFREHWVRGHGRWVPCGPRDDPRYQFRYIKPYKRGDESLGKVEGRTYRMRGEE